MKAYTKSLWRTVSSHIGRFIAITAIIALGIGFTAGLSDVHPKLIDSLDAYYKEYGVPDLVLKSTSPAGFTAEQQETLKNAACVERAATATVMELTDGDDCTRITFMDFDEEVNRLELLEGDFPKDGTEALAERGTNGFQAYKVGEKVEIMGKTVTVSGIVVNPMLFVREPEPALTAEEGEEKYVTSAFYLDNAFQPALPVTDVRIVLKECVGREVFSFRYEDAVEEAEEALKTALGDGAENVAFLTLNENYSSASYNEYGKKVGNISAIFSIFFIAVVALVVLTTMSRLIDEERPMIACFKTLGYGDGKIMLKYILFSLVCCALGGARGALGLSHLLTFLIYQSFEIMFTMPAAVLSFNPVFGFLMTGAMAAAVVAVTAWVTAASLKERPAALLQPKAPKAGKKIFLERIPFLWKRLPFRFKSTCRNLFRYLGRFFMTVLSVSGATALVFAGFGLYDSSGEMGVSSGSISGISAILIICAMLLCILVVYNLTNINVEERRREIATLKVLGYKNGEVAMYIYREVFILSFIGVLLGIPLGAGFATFVFNYVEFGSVANMKWYSWLVSALLSLLFSVIADLLLYRKIVRTDMNASLKTLE